MRAVQREACASSACFANPCSRENACSQLGHVTDVFGRNNHSETVPVTQPPSWPLYRRPEASLHHPDRPVEPLPAGSPIYRVLGSI
jgi:hypothetical protein